MEGGGVGWSRDEHGPKSTQTHTDATLVADSCESARIVPVASSSELKELPFPAFPTLNAIVASFTRTQPLYTCRDAPLDNRRQLIFYPELALVWLARCCVVSLLCIRWRPSARRQPQKTTSKKQWKVDKLQQTFVHAQQAYSGRTTKE